MAAGKNSATVPVIGVVTPVYNEERSLRSYAAAIEKNLFAETTFDVQVVLVDDGSSDGSWSVIEELCAGDSRFRGLRLSRNFGAHAALSAGIDQVEGDAVATLAADLQDPVSVVVEFIEAWRSGAQIVWGRRRSRADEKWRIFPSSIVVRLVRRYAMRRGSRCATGSFFLIDRQVVECFRQFPERNRITFALVAWTGFRQDVVEYDRQSRVSGESGWSFGRMLKAMYDTFIGFSEVPARLMTITGMLTSLLSIPFSLYLVLSWWFTDTVPGWTGLMLGVTVFFGLQFLMMGLVGEYLYRIYSEVTARPLYFISQKLGVPGDNGSDDAR
jgi:dolichol-phosphate mannosyltransferase